MDVHHALPLLAGLSPAQFMRRHWQKKPLLVRAAVADFKPLLSRAELFKLAASQAVESRLIVKKDEQNSDKNGSPWRMKNGPFMPRGLPPISKSGWTLLVQGVDGHDAAVHQLLQRFRFVPDARLDDVMISFATTGGGVGPHFDSYDVFLLQASGRRRWKISRQKDLTLQEGVPLKILQNFEAEEEFVLEAGDMLYLPPRYAHEGVAEGSSDASGKPQDCMTYSIGFKAPAQNELTAELLNKLAEFSEDAANVTGADRPKKMYRDPGQAATANPAELPSALVSFAADAVRQALQDPLAMACALGEIMTAPKAQAWFEPSGTDWDGTVTGSSLRLDAKSRMMYDADHVFINGESYRAKGRDARLMRLLADQRALHAPTLAKAGTDALELLAEWHAEGWVHLFVEPSGDNKQFDH
jgi:50S ribosomal protein L16 3-hydroxylase